MAVSILTPETEARLRVAALVCASLFVVALPFNHTTALRLITLGLAAAFTFASGGWRVAGELPLRASWAAWAGIAALSLVYAHDPLDSFGEFRNEVVYAFLAYATWFALTRHRDGTAWLVRALVTAVAGALVVGISVFVSGRPWFDLGDFGDVGSLTTFLITVLPVLLLFALRSAPRSGARAGAVVLVAGCLAAGFLTLNRIFWLAAAAEIIIFSLFSMRHWKSRRRGVSMLTGVAVVAGLALAQVLLASHSRIALSAPGTDLLDFLVDDPRGDLWRFAVERIAEHPWVGAGIGKWSMRGAFDAHFHNTLRLHAHNVFLNRALETGLPGLAAFVVLLGSIVAGFWRLACSGDARTAAIGAAGLALVVGVIVKNLTDDFLVRQNALLFWSLTGAALGTTSSRHGRLPGTRNRRYTFG
jgi:O-antigen ligase